MPLFSGSEHWGDLELAYKGIEPGGLPGWAREPVVLLTVFVFVAGAIGFGLFMRRVLHHLDPSAAIPGRVRDASTRWSRGS